MKLISIKSNSDFKRAYFRGSKKSSKYLTMYVRRVFCKKIKLGITVTKKVGCAIKRNRARRLIHEAFRTIDIGCINYHVVIVAHQSVLNLKMQDVREDILNLLNYFKIY